MDKQTALSNFFELTLKSLLSGEKVLVVALDKLANKAYSRELKEALREHQKETVNQVKRLEKIFTMLELPAESNRVLEAEGLLEKGKEVIKSVVNLSFTKGNTMIEGLVNQTVETLDHLHNKDIIDYVIVSSAELIEQAELIAYRTALNMAEIFEYREVEKLLKETLAEEKHAYSNMHKLLKNESEALVSIAKA